LKCPFGAKTLLCNFYGKQSEGMGLSKQNLCSKVLFCCKIVNDLNVSRVDRLVSEHLRTQRRSNPHTFSFASEAKRTFVEGIAKFCKGMEKNLLFGVRGLNVR
jgi:hypothetical protein